MSPGLLPLVMSSQGPGLECRPSRRSVNWSLPWCLFTLTDTHFLANCVQVWREPARLCVGFPSSPENLHSGHSCERPRGSGGQNSGILSLTSGVTWSVVAVLHGVDTNRARLISPLHTCHTCFCLGLAQPAAGLWGAYEPTCLVPASAST